MFLQIAALPVMRALRAVFAGYCEGDHPPGHPPDSPHVDHGPS
jgi:hypothetical protein